MTLSLGIVILVVVAVLVAVVALVVRNGGGRNVGGDNPAAPGHGVRQFFQYSLLFGLLVITAVGTSALLGFAAGSTTLCPYTSGGMGVDTYALARDLTYTVVGLPLLALVAWTTWRFNRRTPDELSSVAFAIYVTAASLTSLVVVLTSLQVVLSDVLTASAPDADAGARVITWGVVWVVHWELAARLLSPSSGSIHRVAGSAIALVMATVGMVDTLGASAAILLGNSQLIGGGSALANAVALFITGALAWVRYWLFGSSGDAPSTLWLVHVLVVGMGGGMVLALVGASMSLWKVLVWFLGQPSPSQAAGFFADVPSMAAMVPIGLILWWYHRDVFDRSGPKVLDEVHRTHDYIMTGVSLTGAAWAVVILVASVIETLTDGVEIGIGSRNTLLAALTALAVGLPVWAFFWRSDHRSVLADPVGEVISRSRRIYLTVVIGVSLVAAVVALIATVLAFIQDVTAGVFSAATLRSSRIGIGVLLSAGSVAGYHVTVWREDRARVAGLLHSPASTPDEGGRVHPVEGNTILRRCRPGAPGRRTVVLVGAAVPDVLQQRLRDAEVSLEDWEVAGAPEWDTDEVLAAVSTHHPVGDLLLLAEPGGVRMVPVVSGWR